MLTIRIPSLPPEECSPNWRGHWAARNRAVQAAKNEVMALVLEQEPRREQAIANPVVGVIWGLPSRRHFDYDNLVARTKPFIDGLVASGLMVNDSMDHIEITYVGVLSLRQPYTEIAISTAGETDSRGLVA